MYVKYRENSSIYGTICIKYVFFMRYFDRNTVPFLIFNNFWVHPRYNAYGCKIYIFIKKLGTKKLRHCRSFLRYADKPRERFFFTNSR